MWRRITSPVRARTRKFVPAVIALLMALMISTLACEEVQALSASAGAARVGGGGGVGGSGGIASPEAQLLQRSLELTGELQSFRAHVEMLMMMDGKRLPLSIDMTKAASGRMRLVMDMDSLAPGMRMEMVIADDEMFANLPGVVWVRMDASAMSRILGQAGPGIEDPMGLFNGLFPNGALPASLYNVQSLGKEEVDGVPTEHLVILMDFGRIVKEMSKSSMGQLSQLMSLSGGSGNGGLDSMGINEIEVWIDEDGYNRRTVMTIALNANSSVIFDMRMFGFNDDISVDLPASYTDIPLN